MADISKYPYTVVIIIGFQYKSKPITSHIPQGVNVCPGANTGSIQSNALYGIIIDMSQALDFVRKMNPHRIAVITDIEKDDKWYNLVNAMQLDVIDGTTLTFIQTIQDDNIYHRYISKPWFRNLINNISKDAKRLFFYYTGHGLSGDHGGLLELPINSLSPIDSNDRNTPDVHSSILDIPFTLATKMDTDYSKASPIGVLSFVQSTINDEYAVQKSDSLVRRSIIDSDKGNDIVLDYPVSYLNDPTIQYKGRCLSENTMPIDDIRNLIFNSADDEVESLFLFDCCYGTSMRFPFKIQPDGSIRLVEKRSCKGSITSSKRKYFKSQGICISSVNQREQAVSTSEGSLFTRFLFRSLNNRQRSLKGLVEDIDSEIIGHEKSHNAHQCMVHVTYPTLNNLWLWLFNGEHRYRVIIDENAGVVRCINVNQG
jgi:hypothetical protein